MTIWKETTLGDVCEMYQPKTISVKEMMNDGAYPVYGANGIIGRYNQFNHEEPQLLVTCRGATCGSINISEAKSWITGNAMVVRPRNGTVDLRFLEYAFRGALDITKAITGAAQPQITRTNLGPLKIRFPASLHEQRRIVGILDESFGAIANVSANTGKNVQNARTIFETHLEDVYSRDDNWMDSALSTVCAIPSNLVDPKCAEHNDKLHVGGANIEPKTGMLVNVRSAREEGLTSGKFTFDKTMVLYSKIRPYLIKAARPDFEGLCSADIYPLSPRSNGIDRDYLFYLLLTARFTAYAMAGSARAGMPKVNRDHLFRFRMRLPPLPIQKKFAQQLDALAFEIQRLTGVYQRKLAALDELKQSLLHQAFTGQL